MKSWLPRGGRNVFADIKELIREAEDAGKKIINMGVGQPQGAAFEAACKQASAVILKRDMAVHEYQDSGSPGCPDFARRFVEAHLGISLEGQGVDFLPISGIKSMLGLIPKACGSVQGLFTVATMTAPGYPTPRDQCKDLHLPVQELTLNQDNEFLVDTSEIDPDVKVVMLNYPHNPSGQIMTAAGWQKICAVCEARGLRLFNDNAYYALHYYSEGIALAHIAPEFPNLSWMEGFSASKSIGNGTGWRVGAMVGSSDFIEDLRTVKDNTDSGFTAPQAVGALYVMERYQRAVSAYRDMYKDRVEVLINMLEPTAMRLAVRPQAGFFTLWLAPTKAYGQETPGGEAFNRVMIEKAGVVGVPFGPYIRYSVCQDTKAMAPDIVRAFKRAEISYN